MPDDEGWQLAGCVSFGYPTGTLGHGRASAGAEVTYRNRWGEDSGLEIPDPLWAPE